MQSLVVGVLIRDAEVKKSQKGTEYTCLMLKTKNDEFVRANVFGDDAQAIALLKRGDEVAVVGKLEVGVWQKSATETVPSISLMAHRAVSAVERKAYKPKLEVPTDAQQPFERPFKRFTEVASNLPKTVENLADDIPW